MISHDDTPDADAVSNCCLQVYAAMSKLGIRCGAGDTANIPTMLKSGLEAGSLAACCCCCDEVRPCCAAAAAAMPPPAMQLPWREHVHAADQFSESILASRHSTRCSVVHIHHVSKQTWLAWLQLECRSHWPAEHLHMNAVQAPWWLACNNSAAPNALVTAQPQARDAHWVLCWPCRWRGTQPACRLLRSSCTVLLQYNQKKS